MNPVWGFLIGTAIVFAEILVLLTVLGLFSEGAPGDVRELAGYTLLLAACSTVGYLGSRILVMRMARRERSTRTETFTLPAICGGLVALAIVGGFADFFYAAWGAVFPPAHSGLLPLILGVATLAALTTLLIYGLDVALRNAMESA